MSDVYRKRRKQHEKQDYQDSAVDGDVARDWLGFGAGRYFACASLLSQAMSTEVMLVLENSVVWGGWLV